MTILISVASLLVGALLGSLMMRQAMQKRMRQEVELSNESLNDKNNELESELLKVKQALADTAYKHSELEKDYRYLQQRLES